MRRKHDNSYFHFTKKERTGIMVLVCTLLLFIVTPYLYKFCFPAKIITTDRYAAAIENLQLLTDSSNQSYTRKNNQQYNYTDVFTPGKGITKGSLFYFDPNNTSVAEWKRLGVNDKTIATIQNYLSKGGKFYTPSDIKKIWGLQHMSVRLLPYVQIIKEKILFTNPVYTKKEYNKKQYQDININDADTNSLSLLPGIGAGLSKRIIKYRDKLGGFYAKEQVAETFGLPDSTYQKIQAYLQINGNITKININNTTVEELKAHPYIRYHLANAIVQYRQQHGRYSDISVIQHIMLINDSIYKKISPYLSVD